jgi:hypothetical protein
MATGADFKADFLIKYGEVGTGYFDDTRLNSLIKSATVKVIVQKKKQYAIDKIVTSDVQALILSETGIVPTNATIDVSPTSTDVPTFDFEIAVTVTSPYLSSTVTKSATIKNSNENSSPYNDGIARYPKYQIAADVMKIEPANATLVDIEYFISTVEIDVADGSAEIPYPPKLYDLLLEATVREAAGTDRDFPVVQMADVDMRQNP